MTFVHVYSLADSKACIVGRVECNEVTDKINNRTNIHVKTQPGLGEFWQLLGQANRLHSVHTVYSARLDQIFQS